MAKIGEPVILELASLPREQTGPFLLLGLDKTADKEQIDRNWADRVRWALRQPPLIKVAREDVNWAHEILKEIDKRIRSRYPGEAQVEERAVRMVGDVIPLMGNLCDQLTDQLTKVLDQVRHLPNYQINWSAVREVMRDLQKEFQKLRRITGKCLPLVVSDEHRRIIRDLTEHIDKKMEACKSMSA